MLNNIPESDIKEIVDNLGNNNLQFEDSTVLIYGFAGFLGSIFTSYLFYLNEHILARPAKIIACDNFILGQTPVADNAKFFRVFNHDILVPIDDKLRNIKTIDFVLNFTSIGSPKIYVCYPETVYDIGSIGTKNVLNFCRQVKPRSLILMSSSEIYGGNSERVPFKEDQNVDVSTSGARACYDCSKVALEVLGDLYYSSYNVPVKIIRTFNVVSAGLNLNDGRMIPSFAKSCLEDNPIKVYGQGNETRTVAYGTDFITGMIQILLHGENGARYNLGKDTEETTVFDTAKLVAGYFNKLDLIQLVPPPLGYREQPKSRRPDLTLVRSKFGYNPKISLQETINRYCKWAESVHKKG